MKRSLITAGSIAIILLMISTVTAIPQVQNANTLNILGNIEKNKIIIENKIEKFTENYPLYNFFKFNISKFIDFLIRLIDFIVRVSGFIASIIGTLSLIYSIVNQLNYYISIIIQILEWFDAFLNPQGIIIRGN
jgi:hypothetical protein